MSLIIVSIELSPQYFYNSVVVCIPSCENGACVATNTCLCTEGYSGDTCAKAGNKLL